MGNSRYIQTMRSKTPRHKRSERVPGSFEDSGKWIKCWNCGFTINLDRLKASSGSGIIIEDAYAYSDPPTMISLDTGADLPLILLKPSGTPETDYYTPRKSYSVAGCPFCGCTNLP